MNSDSAPMAVEANVNGEEPPGDASPADEDDDGWTHSIREGDSVAVEEPSSVTVDRPGRRKSTPAEEVETDEPPLSLEAAVAAVPEETRRLMDELFRGQIKGVVKIDREKLF